MINVAVSLLAGVLMGGPGDTSADAGAPKFELVSGALKFRPDGGIQESRPCFYGKHPSGIPVLLLSERDSGTCAAKTGEVGTHFFDGTECTILDGAEACGESFTLAVMGARGAYRRVELVPVKDAKARVALVQAIKRGGVAEAATKRWKNDMQPLSFDPCGR
jgi:hypothetical protein